MSTDEFVLTPCTGHHPQQKRSIVQSVDELLRKRELEAEKRLGMYLSALADDPTPVLFDELLEYLRQPLIARANLPDNIRNSDRFDVAIIEELCVEEQTVVDTLDIPYEPWGASWVVDVNGLSWSEEAIRYLQIHVFWESLEELALSNNEHEKWSVLKWIFMPAIRKQYMWDTRLGRSHCLETHERDHPFSFHNCAIGARMDEEEVREAIRQRLPADILKAVVAVCTFSF